MGNSTNKKDAQTNAARDFVNFLVRVGEMSAAEVPALGVRTITSKALTLSEEITSAQLILNFWYQYILWKEEKITDADIGRYL